MPGSYYGRIMAAKKSASRKSRPARPARPAEGGYTVPGISRADGHHVAEILQMRLHSLNDLALTLKHVHWNVVGPHFIGVHEMIDPHVVEVRDMVDETAERMATLGVSPAGTPGAIVAGRTWDDYRLGRATTNEHLGALDIVYEGLVADHREAMESVSETDSVTEDMLIAQVAKLELFQWFVRAHLESTAGDLSTSGAQDEKGASQRASQAAKKRG